MRPLFLCGDDVDVGDVVDFKLRAVAPGPRGDNGLAEHHAFWVLALKSLQSFAVVAAVSRCDFG